MSETAKALLQDIERALRGRGLKNFGGDGWSNNIPCLFAQHSEDAHTPAFGWNNASGTGKCFKCQRSYSPFEVATALGIDTAAYRAGSQASGSASGRSKARLLELPIEAEPDGLQKLRARGISAGSLTRYKVVLAGDFWRYPTLTGDKTLAYREKCVYSASEWKAAGHTGGYRKYLWQPAKPKNAPYYGLGYLQQSITEAGGVVYFSSGEPNVWVLHSALCAGDPDKTVNATFWFDGETSVPETLAADMQALGVVTVIYAPDCDATGNKAAYTVRERLQGSGIHLRTLQLPGALDSGYDINDFWLDCNCDAQQFQSAFDALPDFVFETTAPARATCLTDLYPAFISSLAANSPNDAYTEPLPMPFRSWHRFGGFARVLTAGKGMLLVARAASGKTSMLETLADGWNKQGIDVLFYGSEWTAMEYLHRRIHRYCRDVLQAHEDTPDYWVSYDDFNLHGLSKNEQTTPEELRIGSLLTPKQVEVAVRTVDHVMAWRGDLDILDGERPLAELLEQAALSIDARRKAGRRVGVVIFDYLQIIDGFPELSEAQRLERVLGAIKAWAIQKRIPWIVASQVGKQDSKDSRRAGAGLDADSALYVRDAKPNLVVTLNVQYEQNDYGERVVKRGIVEIAKNNTGRLGRIDAMHPDFKRLRWIEKDITA